MVLIFSKAEKTIILSIFLFIFYSVVPILGKNKGGKVIPLNKLSTLLHIRLEKGELHQAGKIIQGKVVIGYEPGVSLEVCKTFPLGTVIYSVQEISNKKYVIRFLNTREMVDYTWEGDISHLISDAESYLQDKTKVQDCFPALKKEGCRWGEMRYFLRQLGYRKLKSPELSLIILQHPVMDYNSITFREKRLSGKDIIRIFGIVSKQTGLDKETLCRLMEIL